MSALLTSDALNEVLSHPLVIDITMFKSGDDYCGKACTHAGDVEATEKSPDEMLMELLHQVQLLSNASRN